MTQDDIERNIAFIIEQQASFFADLGLMKETQEKAIQRLDRLERVFKLGVTLGMRERRARHELEAKLDALIDTQIKTEDALQRSKTEFDTKIVALTEAQSKTDAKIAALIEAQSKTDAKIAALIEAQSKTDAKIAALIKAQAKAEEREQQSKRELDAKLATMLDSQARMNAALADMARAIVQTNGRIDYLSTK